MANIEIKEGQVWSYKSREGEEGSTFTILKVENLTDVQQAIHIRIDGVKIKKENAPDGFITYIEHLPVSFRALAGSVLDLKAATEVTLPKGYFYWKDEFLAGRAGCFDISLSEVVTFVETTLYQ